MAKERKHIRWLPPEWLKVAAHAVNLIERNGAQPVDALWAAQNELPEHRRQPLETIKRFTGENVHGDIWRKNAAIVLSMSDADRSALLLRSVASPKAPKVAPKLAAPPPPKPEKPATKPHGRAVEVPGGGGKRKIIRAEAPPYAVVAHSGHSVKWTDREWALIARSAKWVSEQYPQSRLWEQVFYAQQWTLPADRQRAMGGMRQSVDHGPQHMRLANRIADGLRNVWQVEGIPFTPPGSEPAAPAELPTPAPVASPVRPAEAMEAPPSPAPTPQATQAPPVVRSSLAEAAKAFGETMMSALDTLLASHSHALLAQVNERIEASAVAMGANVAAMVQAGMARAVHDMMQIELGGTIAPPAAAEVAQAPKPEAGGVNIDAVHGLRKIKVDVVGVPHGTMLHEIQRGIDLNAVDVNFVHPDGAFAPHRGRHLIMIQQKIPHSLSNKIKAAKIKPTFVPRATAGHVIHAIEELQRSAHQ